MSVGGVSSKQVERISHEPGILICCQPLRKFNSEAGTNYELVFLDKSLSHFCEERLGTKHGSG